MKSYDVIVVGARCAGAPLALLLAREGYLALDEVGRMADEILQALVVAHAAGIDDDRLDELGWG